MGFERAQPVDSSTGSNGQKGQHISGESPVDHRLTCPSSKSPTVASMMKRSSILGCNLTAQSLASLLSGTRYCPRDIPMLYLFLSNLANVKTVSWRFRIE